MASTGLLRGRKFAITGVLYSYYYGRIWQLILLFELVNFTPDTNRRKTRKRAREGGAGGGVGAPKIDFY